MLKEVANGQALQRKLKVEENVDEKSCITAALDKGTQDNVERNNNTLGARWHGGHLAKYWGGKPIVLVG